MTTVLAVHEVDDVEHWKRSTKREEFFGPRGMTAQVFVDPDGSDRVGLLIEVPNMATLTSALESEEAALAMKHDGVRPETLQLLVQA